MRLFPRILLTMLVAVQAATSAVIYVDLPEPEGFLGGVFGQEGIKKFDFDQNGVTDLQFSAGLEIYGFFVTSPNTTRVVGVSEFGVVPMQFNESIGSILGPTENPRAAVYADPQRWFAVTQYFQLSHGFNDNGDVVGGPWHPFEDAYGEDAYLGFEFQGEGGAHYGWIRIHEFAGLGGFFREYAYEDVASVGIRAGQIPETSSLSFITGGIALAVLRRRRGLRECDSLSLDHRLALNPDLGGETAALRSAAAVRGVDNRNNVEKVSINTPAAGRYRITLTHAGGLPNNTVTSAQLVSTVLSGVTSELPRINSLAVSPTATQYLLTFTADPGAYFTLQSSPDLMFWTDSGSVLAVNVTNTVLLNSAISDSKLFWRMRRGQ